MDMNKDETIEISQVGNGYIVRPGGQWFGGNEDLPRRWPLSSGEYFVFRTMAELQTWLCDHFTHRATVERNDASTDIAA